MDATNEINEAIADYEEHLADVEEATRALEKAKRRVIDLAAINGHKQLTATFESRRVIATVSSRTLTKFNEEGLRKALGANGYKRLCKLTLDKAKVEDAITNGKVDPVVVAQFTDITRSAPYIRLTEKPKDDD